MIWICMNCGVEVQPTGAIFPTERFRKAIEVGDDMAKCPDCGEKKFKPSTWWRRLWTRLFGEKLVQPPRGYK